jgi:hypothetical protein
VTLTTMPYEPAQVVQALADHDAVLDAVQRYTQALDRYDGALLESALTEDATVDLSPAIARMGGEFPPLSPRAVILEQLLPAVGPLDTSHAISNPRISLDGDTATLTCYALAEHYPPGQGSDPKVTRHALMMNRYTADLVRDGGQWRIRTLVIENSWFRGDITLLLP